MVYQHRFNNKNLFLSWIIAYIIKNKKPLKQERFLLYVGRVGLEPTQPAESAGSRFYAAANSTPAKGGSSLMFVVGRVGLEPT